VLEPQHFAFKLSQTHLDVTYGTAMAMNFEQDCFENLTVRLASSLAKHSFYNRFKTLANDSLKRTFHDYFCQHRRCPMSSKIGCKATTVP